MRPQTLGTLYFLTLMLFWQNLLGMAKLTLVPDYNMLSQRVNLWSGNCCDPQQKQVTDVFHITCESGIDVDMNGGSCPSQSSWMWGVTVMGCHFPSAMVENSLKHLGVVKNTVETQLCNKYPACILLTSTNKDSAEASSSQGKDENLIFPFFHCGPIYTLSAFLPATLALFNLPRILLKCSVDHIC